MNLTPIYRFSKFIQKDLKS